MQDLKQKIEQVRNKYFVEIVKIKSIEELEELRLKYLSRSGEIASLMHNLKDLNKEDKIAFGPILNNLKIEAEEAYKLKKAELEGQKLNQEENKKKYFDVTSYLPNQPKGSLHPYTHVIEKLENIFISMGYEIVEGPELEDDFHNFQALNIPADHPARDMQDTFWLNIPNKLMRTHTSTMQIREMENKKPPFAIFATGRAYRNEATDASHDFVFMQTECLVVDKNLSMSNLFATIKTSLQAIFEQKDLDIRVRPSYFPFVEPGFDIDMRCPFCTTGCSVCKRNKWVEIVGAGLVHPNVLKSCNIDPNVYTGFAYAFGLTRLVMLKYGINDIRLLNSGRLDFLEQF